MQYDVQSVNVIEAKRRPPTRTVKLPPCGEFQTICRPPSGPRAEYNGVGIQRFAVLVSNRDHGVTAARLAANAALNTFHTALAP